MQPTEPDARVAERHPALTTILSAGAVCAPNRVMTSLARAGISVVRGFAKRVSEESWIAEFQVQAVDAGPEWSDIDYLASLLDRLARLSLLPEQISLETWEGRALDCFHLKMAGGGPPQASTARELAAMLDTLKCLAHA